MRLSRFTAQAAIFVLITLIQLELVLRLSGFAFQLVQDIRNSHGPSGPTGYRIITLGESTTADASAPRQRPWPRILEGRLQAAGIPAHVYNHGVVASTSTALIRTVPAAVDETHPQLVIAMMGINDDPRFRINAAGLVTRGSFLGDLRILKLFRWTKQLVQNFSSPQRPEIEHEAFEEPDWGEEYLIFTLFRKPLSPLRNERLASYLRYKSDWQKAWFYERLAASLKDSPLAGEFRKKLLSLSLDLPSSAGTFAWHASRLGKRKDCQWLARQYLDRGKTPSAVTLSRLATCLPEDSSELLEILTYFGDWFELGNPEDPDPTWENYLTLYRMLREKGICLIAMQYPLHSHSEKSRELVKSERFLLLVDNKDNFEAALRHHKQNEIFTDMFAGDFGHTTELGHELIADRAASAILKLASEHRCGL